MKLNVELEDLRKNKSLGLPAIIRILLFGPVEARRHAAARLNFETSVSPKILKTVCSALEDEDPTVREFVVNALQRLGPDAAPAMPGLCKRLRGCNIYEVRYILWALLSMGPAVKAAWPEVKSLLNSYDHRVRYLCLQLIGIGTPKDPAVVTFLESSLRDKHDEVRSLAESIYQKILPQVTV